MADNERQTRIRLTAVDEASKPLESIRSAVKGLGEEWGRLNGTLAALGVTAVVGGLVAMVKSSIDAAAAMADVSQKTGIAVQQLTALDYAMRREGVSTEAFGKAMGQLSKSVVEASDASSKAGQIFKALGVSANAGPREAMLQLADAFQSLPDGATKSALALQLFGRTGADLIPVLNNGAAGIREMEQEAQRLGITFNDDLAKSAKEFKDRMFALEESSKSLGYVMAEQMLPSLNRIVLAMREAAIESGKLSALWVGLGGVAAEALGLQDDAATKLSAHLRSLQADALKLGEALKPDRRQALIEGVVEPATMAEGAFLRLQNQIRATKDELDRLAGKKKPGEEGFAESLAQSIAEAAGRQAAQGIGQFNQNRLNGILNGGGAAQLDPARNLLIQLQLEYTKLNSITKDNETLERTLAELRKDSYANASKSLKAEAIEQAKKIDLKKRELAVDAFLDEDHKKEIAAAEARKKIVDELANGWKEATEQLESESKLLGLTNIERQKAVLLEKARKDIESLGDSPTAQASIRENLEKQLSLLTAINDKEVEIASTQRKIADTVRVWDDLAQAAGDFFRGIIIEGRSAFDSLKAFVKQLLAEMIALFARQWILSLGASLTGGGLSTALSQAAGSAGSGSLAGSLLGSAGSAIGGTALGQFWGGLTGSIAGPAMPGTALAYGQQFSSFLQGAAGVLSYFAIAVAGAAIAAHQFAQGWRIDGGGSGQDYRTNNPASPLFMASAMDRTYRALGFNDQWAAILSGSSLATRIFGRRQRTNDAYGLSGEIGPMGISGRNWQDWSRQGGWFTSTQRGTDFSDFSPEQSQFMTQFFGRLQQVTGTLGQALHVDPSQVLANYSRPFNFQLSSNGQPLTDEEISRMFGELMGSALQEQVSMLLDAGGKGALADYIRSLKEEGDALTAEIVEFVNVLSALPQLNTGRFALNIDMESLMAFQREGETIGQTFERFTGSWSQLVNAFASDDTKLQAAREALAKLGIQLPATREGYLDLMRGLDLSTEAGRTLYQQLLELAPAFDLVTSASEAAAQALAANLDAFDTLMGTLRGPSYTAGVQTNQLDSLVGQFQGANPWSSGMSTSDFLVQLRTITREDFSHYSAANQRLILQILGLDHTLNGTNTALQENTAAIVSGPSASGRSPQETAFEEYYRARGARNDLGGYLDSLMLNKQLSPLSQMDQLGAAKGQYEKTLAAAQGGDVDAIGRLHGVSDAYLQIAREIYASSADYQKIFEAVFNADSKVAEVADYNTRMIQIQTRQASLTEIVANVLERIRAESREDAGALRSAVDVVAGNVRDLRAVERR